MAIIANDTQFIGIAPSIDLTGKKSAILNEQTEPVTMADIIETVGGGSSYLVYTAILNQSGTNAPVATVLENTIDATLLWTYSGVGDYLLSLPSFPSGSPFIVGKTFVHIGSTITGPLALYANNNTSMGVPQSNGIVVNNYTTLFANTNGFTNVSIEIRVYP